MDLWFTFMPDDSSISSCWSGHPVALTVVPKTNLGLKSSKVVRHGSFGFASLQLYVNKSEEEIELSDLTIFSAVHCLSRSNFLLTFIVASSSTGMCLLGVHERVFVSCSRGGGGCDMPKVVEEVQWEEGRSR